MKYNYYRYGVQIEVDFAFCTSADGGRWAMTSLAGEAITLTPFVCQFIQMTLKSVEIALCFSLPQPPLPPRLN